MSSNSVDSSAVAGRKALLQAALDGVTLPGGVAVRRWRPADFPAVQRLSAAEGWPTTTRRPAEALVSWRRAWPALVATPANQPEEVIAFLRALTDGAIATYVCEFIVDVRWRGTGVGRALMDVCHALYPRARIDLLSTPGARGFYARLGFDPHTGFRRSHA
jgi:predicted N-acetyltransferase YhbS